MGFIIHEIKDCKMWTLKLITDISLNCLRWRVHPFYFPMSTVEDFFSCGTESDCDTWRTWKGFFFSQFIVKLFLSWPLSWSSTGHIYAINHQGFQDFDIDSTSTLYLRIEDCLWKVPVNIHEHTVHRITLAEITVWNMFFSKFTFCLLSYMQLCPGYLEFWM